MIKQLSSNQRKSILNILAARFEAIAAMEQTGGEPDITIERQHATILICRLCFGKSPSTKKRLL